MQTIMRCLNDSHISHIHKLNMTEYNIVFERYTIHVEKTMKF